MTIAVACCAKILKVIATRITVSEMCFVSVKIVRTSGEGGMTINLTRTCDVYASKWKM